MEEEALLQAGVQCYEWIDSCKVSKNGYNSITLLTNNGELKSLLNLETF